MHVMTNFNENVMKWRIFFFFLNTPYRLNEGGSGNSVRIKKYVFHRRH